jgi:hypothetical protein
MPSRQQMRTPPSRQRKLASLRASRDRQALQVPRERQQDNQHPQPFVWVLEHATGVLTIAGLIVYGLVRLGIDAFYSRLGVTTEEVGLTYAAILSRAALGLLVAFVAAMLAASFSSVQLFVGYYFARAARRVPDTENVEPRNLTKLEAGQVAQPWLVIAFLSLPGGALTLLAVYRLISPGSESVTTSRLFYLISSVFTLLGVALSFLYAVRAASPAVRGKARWPQTGTRIAISVLVLLLFTGIIWASNRPETALRSAWHLASPCLEATFMG